jgi:hypothetical protein
MLAWRGVESQHVVSTLRLVDSAQEQILLELLLEQSKPKLPPTLQRPPSRVQKHYLLYTPFRYRPQHPSRFRPAGSLGIWYGAENLYTACAEVAYWRSRFMLDSPALAATVLLTEHSFFQARVEGAAIDLMRPPWLSARAAWTKSNDYTETQALAALAKAKGLQWIGYESVRAPGERCAAVLDLDALNMLTPETPPQTWHCKASRESVMLVNGSDCFVWRF